MSEIRYASATPTLEQITDIKDDPIAAVGDIRLVWALQSELHPWTTKADEIERLRAEIARLTAELAEARHEREKGTAALRIAFGEELWKLGHPAYVVVHLREELEKVSRLWKEAEVRCDALAQDAARYRWLANRVLACDYGDNDAIGEQIGWCIRHDLLGRDGQRQPAFMYGASIDAAIDAMREGGK